MIGDAIALLELVRKFQAERSIRSALFRWKGKRAEGDEAIKVVVHPLEGNDSVWWYEVSPLAGHHFIRVPVNASAVIESLGKPSDSSNLDSDFFRYVPVPDGHIFGGEIPNVKVDFMVFAYRSSDLLSVGKGQL